VLGDIGVHEFPQHLCGRLILHPANRDKAIAKFSLNSYAETDIFHWAGVPNGYTKGEL
jgi:hypothetical protein